LRNSDIAINFAPDHVSLCDYVKKGALGSQFCESEDPKRMVPIVCSPDDFVITVSGDPCRTNAYLFVSNGCLVYPTSKRIELPTNWSKMLKMAKKGVRRPVYVVSRSRREKHEWQSNVF
jgi:hypothetical protein